MKTYEQTSDLIACNSFEEFVQKFNKLKVSADFPYTIRPDTPTATDTRQWYRVYYHKQIPNR